MNGQPPTDLIDYLLCKTFGWTLDELDRQDSKKLKRFILIMGIDKQNEAVTSGLPTA